MAFESIENAHFRAKNANRVIASACIVIFQRENFNFFIRESSQILQCKKRKINDWKLQFLISKFEFHESVDEQSYPQQFKNI